MHVLLSAYACRPNAGTEAGNGWGWATNLALRGVRVHVVTLSSNREAIVAEQQRNPISNLSFSFAEPRPRSLKEGHGLHYLLWQFAALRMVRPLHRIDPFDVVHHVTYGSIHVPTQLWRLGIPTVFGPVGGGQVSPYKMRRYFGKDQRKELLRTAFTRFLPYSPLHRRWIQRMAIVYAGNDETLQLAKKLGCRAVVLAMDTGLPDDFFSDVSRHFTAREGPLRLLWTGRMLPRKALLLTLDAVARARADVSLTILGDGCSPEEVRAMIAERGLTDKVSWSGGRVPWTEVREAYLVHDAFLFTSLRDSCGSQLLEAMALGLPVITLDHQGAHCLIPADAGIKVPVTDQASTIGAIANAIDRFASFSPEKRNSMSLIGWRASRILAWSARAKRAESLYALLIAQASAERNASVTSSYVSAAAPI